MIFVFTEKKMNPSDELRAYAEKKIGKLDKLFKEESTAYVTFGLERNRNIAEVTVHNNGMFYRVKESTNDMYVSIDAAVASITRQVRKNKTRLEKRIREGALDKEFAPPARSDDEEEKEFKVVRTKRFSIKPMSVDEAILQMNLLEHEFFVFRNEDSSGAFSVVYKRRAGDYGLIESTDSDK
ncbi:MAG: ribosome-associated translation inhibitor RaiA [Oscillospiraceae bacterium]|nr:ribosome-associated translation inhibitor RaiA [Oscillospiraceae bacterium]